MRSLSLLLFLTLVGCAAPSTKPVVFIKKNPTAPIDINRLPPADVYRYCRGHRACAWKAFGICTVIVPNTDTGPLLTHELNHCQKDL